MMNRRVFLKQVGSIITGSVILNNRGSILDSPDFTPSRGVYNRYSQSYRVALNSTYGAIGRRTTDTGYIQGVMHGI